MISLSIITGSDMVWFHYDIVICFFRKSSIGNKTTKGQYFNNKDNFPGPYLTDTYSPIKGAFIHAGTDLFCIRLYKI